MIAVRSNFFKNGFKTCNEICCVLSSKFYRSMNYIRIPFRSCTASPNDVDRKGEFTCTVYRLPHIRYAVLVNRMKAFQTAVTVSSTTIGYFLYGTGIISSSFSLGVLGIGIGLMLPIYTLGILSNNLIGYIYISEDKKRVKIAHVNFWGRRRETVMEVDDIVPLSEAPDNPFSLLSRINRYSKPCKLKITLKYGAVENHELFSKIFGSTGKKL